MDRVRVTRQMMEWLLSIGAKDGSVIRIDENSIHIPRIVIKDHRPYSITYKLLPDEPGIPCTYTESKHNE